MSDKSKRDIDDNGWMLVRDNPLTKVGIYPYMGHELGLTGDDANKIFRAYRPAEELQDPETIESAKLMPFIDDHEWLGINATPAEKKGMQGVVGENVFYDDPYLRGNIRIHSAAAQALISSKKKIELSPAYRCQQDWTPGDFNGEGYDFVQRKIRFNHLALVEEGRTGADVSVQDRSVITLDTSEFITMDLDAILAAIAEMSEEDKAALLAAIQTSSEDEPGEMTPEQEQAAAASAAELTEAAATLEEAGNAAAEAAETGDPDAVAEAQAIAETAIEEAEAAVESTEALDAMKAKIAQLEKQVAAQDTASLLKSISRRDQLATKVSQYVGTFDHTGMTEAQVAEYGVKKLGIKCGKGVESIALDAWMQGRQPESKQASTAMDSRVDAHSVKSKLWGDK